MGLSNLSRNIGPARLLPAIAASVLGSFVLLQLVDAAGFADRQVRAVVALGAAAWILLIAGSYGWLVDRVWRTTTRQADQDVVAFKDEFVARISHELRTPLTAIVGYAHLLEARTAGETEALHMVVSQSMELSRLVDDLATTARLDADLVTINPRPISIRQEVAAAASFLDVLGLEAHLECRDAQVLVDSEHFRHIVRNLLVNAFRHGAPPVAVRGQSSGDRYICQVVDAGPGVDDELVDRLFTRFVHGGDGHRAAGAVGLGLSVVRELGNRMGCEVSYRRIKDESHFVLNLPLARPRSEGRASALWWPEPEMKTTNTRR